MMITHTQPQEASTSWYAIKTRQEFRAEEELAPLCDEVLFLKERSKPSPGHRSRIKAIIPRVLFVKTTSATIQDLEQRGRKNPELSVPFWIYRYPDDDRIQVIPETSIRLLRLLTADDTTRCEIFSKKDFMENQHVRVTGGSFEGYEGYVVRVKKNRHVIVKIEGVCMLMLPYIHPDLLEHIE